MNIWELETLGVYYDLINEGKKQYELRAPDPSIPSSDYTKLQPGDIVKIVRVADYSFVRLENEPYIDRVVEFSKNFRNLQEALDEIDFRDINPYAETREEYEDTVYSFPEYFDRIEKYGVVIIKLKEDNSAK